MKVPAPVKKILAFPLALFLTTAANASSDFAQCRAVKSGPKRLQCYDALPLENVKPSAIAANAGGLKPVEWSIEPASFLGVKLDLPVDASFDKACPVKKETYSESLDDYAWKQTGKPRCFFDRPKTQPHWGEFRGHGVEAFRQEQIFMYQSNLVGKAIARFFSGEYGGIVDSLTKKYGPPTTMSKSVFRLNNGAELPNESATWVGKNGILSVEALEKRDVDRSIIDYGAVTWTSLKYINESLNAADKKNAERSEKF